MKAIQLFILAVTNLFFLFNTVAIGQQETGVPKNYLSVFGGIEWNTTSAAAGLEYERGVYEGKQLLFSIKGVMVLPYKYDNVALLSHSDGSRSVLKTAVMATGNFYTGSNPAKNGFYFCASSGFGMTTDEYPTYNAAYSRVSRLRFSGETGAGIQFKLSNKVAMRLTGTVLWGMFTGGYTITRISVCF